MIENTNLTKIRGLNSGAPKGCPVPVPLGLPVMVL